jgi:hypothetical protein
MWLAFRRRRLELGPAGAGQLVVQTPRAETLRKLRIDLESEVPLPEDFVLRDLSITYKPVPNARDGVVAAQRRMFGQSELF